MQRAITTIILVISLVAGAVSGQALEVPAPQVVEVLLTPEHAPEGLKSGDKVDLKMVTGKAGIGKRTIYMSQTLATSLEVRGLSRLDKPDKHGRCIRVELIATSEVAKIVEKTKPQLVTVVETVPGEGTTTARRPVPFRLERAKP